MQPAWLYIVLFARAFFFFFLAADAALGPATCDAHAASSLSDADPASSDSAASAACIGRYGRRTRSALPRQQAPFLSLLRLLSAACAAPALRLRSYVVTAQLCAEQRASP